MDSTPKVTTAEHRTAFDANVQSPIEGRDGRMILPPPPQTMGSAAMSPSDTSTTSNSSYNQFGTPSPTPPTPPATPPAPAAPSPSMDQTMNAPPSMSGPAASSSASPFGAGTSAKSGPVPPGMDYMSK